jgi:hypothetical protein
MKLFGRKNGKGASGGPDAKGRRKGDRLTSAGTGAGAGDAAGQSRGGALPVPVAHRLTKDLARAESLAAMLAHSRAAAAVEVADLLAGMYIYDWERLSKYWPEQDAVEEYLQQICRISPQRWHYWIEFYDQQRRGGEKTAKWQWPRPAKDPDADGKPLARSSELNALLKSAEELAPAHDVVEGRNIPILTCECVLLAIAKRTDSEIGHRLIASGLSVFELEQAARNPRHAPLH